MPEDSRDDGPPERKLLVGHDRFYLVPVGVRIAPGSVEAMDLGGEVVHLDPLAAAAFEVTRDEASEFVMGRMQDAFAQATTLVSAFTDVFRQTAREQGHEGGGDLSLLLRGMMDSVVGVSGDPERLAHLRESIDRVAADLDGADEGRLAEALRSFPERLSAELAAKRDEGDA